MFLGLGRATSTNSIIESIDIQFTVIQAKHTQDCCWVNVATVPMPDVADLKEQVGYFKEALTTT